MIDFETIKTAVHIEDLMNYYGIHTNRQGMACCPLHNEKTPSFKVYPKTNSFYCFGCGAGGDVIKFVELMENVGAASAARMLDGVFGLGVCDTKIDPALMKEQIRRKRKKEALERYKAWERGFIDKLIAEKPEHEKILRSSEVFSDLWCSAQNRLNEINNLLDIFLTSGDGYEHYRAEIYKNGGKLHCLI